MFELKLFIKYGPFGIFNAESKPIIVRDYEILDKYLYYEEGNIRKYIELDRIESFEIKGAQ